MGKCCTLNPPPRAQRRINGFQQPLNCQQVIGWIVIVITAIVNFAMLMQIQFEELKIIANVIYVVLYMSHIIAHVMATMIDPSEDELRKLEINNVPEFDRSVHAHVIENGRCHLCNINTSSRSTKHCSLCNKCVDRFDHHCKWLNNCVGHRNYPHFIASVTTALMISLFTSCLCFAYIAIFFLNRQRLSPAVQKLIDCDGLENYCGNSISFLTFLIIYGGCASGIGGALFHLCCFHVYISVLGVSTYEYMMKGYSSSLWMSCCTGCRCGRISPFKVYKTKDNDSKNQKQGGSMNNQTVGNLINIVIGEELVKKRNIFDKNKIHPEEIGDR